MGQQQATAQPGGATSGQQSSFEQVFKQGAGTASHANGKGAQQGVVCRARSFLKALLKIILLPRDRTTRLSSGLLLSPWAPDFYLVV